MAYYTKVLQPDEQVKYAGKLHWTIYRTSIFLVLLAAITAVLCLKVPDENRSLAWWVPLLLLILALPAFLGAWFVRVTTEIVVTDRRIIHKTGWISRRTQEINVSKVETVDVDQGIMGRVFNYGTVLIRGVGGGWEPLRRIADPLHLRNAIVVG